MYTGDDESVSRVRWPNDEALAERLATQLATETPDPSGKPATQLSRRERLARIRRAVAASEYENPLKLSIALDRVLDRINRLG